MTLFKIPGLETRKKKQEKALSAIKRKGSTQKDKKQKRLDNIYSKIEQIRKQVAIDYKDVNYLLLTTTEQVKDYLDICRKNNFISIDTETAGTRTDIARPALDTMTCKLVGICIHTYGQPGAYIPINHVDYKTGERLENQLTEKDVTPLFKDLNIYTTMFNAGFDIKVLRQTLGIYVKCHWDSSIGAKLLNENELAGDYKLKILHGKYVLRGESRYKDFQENYNIEADLIPIELFAPYGAMDGVITTEYHDFQKKYLAPKTPLEDVHWLFKNIEMPVVKVVADMEDTGVALDMEKQQELSVSYNARLDDSLEAVYRIFEEEYGEEYKKWLQGEGLKLLDTDGKPLASKMGDPINFGSPKQLGILLFDFMKMEVPKKGRTTDVNYLRGIQKKVPFVKALLEYRAMSKMVGTYIDKMPNCLSPVDNRIHCSFNQCGARTGRFSSSDPNLQNIPARDREIRKMFKATDAEYETPLINNTYKFKYVEEIFINEKWVFVKDLKIGDVIEGQPIINIEKEEEYVIVQVPNGKDVIKTRTRYVLMSSDFSQQEPKLMAQLCGDKDMLEACHLGKDLYATIAAMAFHTTYENCLEFPPEGTPLKKDKGGWTVSTMDDYDKLADGKTDVNDDGKKRRNQAKSILLGVLYGRETASIAEQLKCSEEEAEAIKQSVFTGFPAIKNFEDSNKEFASKYGYVTTLWGRKRRLPEMRWLTYEAYYPNEPKRKVPEKLALAIDKKMTEINNLKWWEANKLRPQFENRIKEEYGLEIKDNYWIKSETERQVVNSIIQGSAADMSKKAMISVHNDEELNKLGFRLLIPVHDELIGECPLVNAIEGRKRFKYLMENCATDRLKMDIKCDVTCTWVWYGDEIDLEKELEGGK